MGYKVDAAREFAKRIKDLGFRVWLASSGEYGFVSDETGARVLPSSKFEEV